jgi:hypothetical protein
LLFGSFISLSPRVTPDGPSAAPCRRGPEPGVDARTVGWCASPIAEGSR